MKTSYIYKDEMNEFHYVNNNGRDFLLTEAFDFGGHRTYDLVVAIEVLPEPFAEVGETKVFFGASEIDDYISGKNNDFLEACREQLND